MNNTNQCNIIITHKGNPSYLKFVLSQLQETNPNANIILMGDKSNQKHSKINLFNLSSKKIKHVLLDDYFEYAKKFQQVYVHNNFTDINYELFCYQRWFCVYEYMIKNNLEDAFAIDSDVLIYEDLYELHDFVKKYDFALSAKNLEEKNPGLWMAGPPIAYFHVKTLKKLCEFFIKSYSDEKCLQLFKAKMDWHHSRLERFGICDMTQIFLFTKEHQNNFFNFSQPFMLNGEKYKIDETILDTTDCIADKYQKKLIFENNHPYAFYKKDNSKLRFPLIHFQGYSPINAKEWIPDYYKGKRYKYNILIKNIIYKIKRTILQKKYIWSKCKGLENNTLILPKNINNCKKLKVKIKGQGNVIDLSEIAKIKNKSQIIVIGNNNKINFGCKTDIKGKLELKIEGDNAVFQSGNEVTVDEFLSVYQQTAANIFIGDKTSFFVTSIQSIHKNTSVIIGKDCMFSRDTFLFNTDGHPIYNQEKIICNKPRDLVIGNHVWVGWGSSILKGLKIADNCIIGRSTIVTKNVLDEGSIIVGNPGRVIKDTVKSWARYDENFLL